MVRVMITIEFRTQVFKAKKTLHGGFNQSESLNLEK